MRKYGWKSKLSLFLYDRQIGGKRMTQMKKSFQEVSHVLQGEPPKKEEVKKQLTDGQLLF